MKKRIQRPRLEETKRSAVTARLIDDNTFPIEIRDPGSLSVSKLTLYETKRLHKFLGRAIEFLESKQTTKE